MSRVGPSYSGSTWIAVPRASLIRYLCALSTIRVHPEFDGRRHYQFPKNDN